MDYRILFVTQNPKSLSYIFVTLYVTHVLTVCYLKASMEKQIIVTF